MKLASLISGFTDYTHLLSIKVKLLSLSHLSSLILNYVLCVKPEKERNWSQVECWVLNNYWFKGACDEGREANSYYKEEWSEVSQELDSSCGCFSSLISNLQHSRLVLLLIHVLFLKY